MVLRSGFNRIPVHSKFAQNSVNPVRHAYFALGKAIAQTCWNGVGLMVAVMLLILMVNPQSAAAENYTKMTLIERDFSNQVLTDANFSDANLRNSNLSHSDLTGVRFFGANLEQANLEGAKLSFATLDNARLVRANLKDAVLEGAFAFNANFAGADIEGTDFTDVFLTVKTQEKLCEIASGQNPTTGRLTRDTLECF